MKKMTKKLLSMMLALAMVLTLIPAMGVVAQAAEVIFKTNMEYSVAIDGNLLELIPKDENRPEDAKHIVKYQKIQNILLL